LALAITQHGEQVLTTAWGGTQDRLQSQIEKLSPEQRKAVAQAMRSLKTVFGAMGLGDFLDRSSSNGVSVAEALEPIEQA
jgi:hypothetical protein